MVVLPVPFTPTTSTQAGRPSTRDDTIERSIDGSTRASSSSRSQPRTVASSVLPSTATLVRSASTRSVVAATPRSAARRVSSTSSHAASSSVPPDSRASSPLPRARVRPGQAGAQPAQPAGRRLGALDGRRGGRRGRQLGLDLGRGRALEGADRPLGRGVDVDRRAARARRRRRCRRQLLGPAAAAPHQAEGDAADDDDDADGDGEVLPQGVDGAHPVILAAARRAPKPATGPTSDPAGTASGSRAARSEDAHPVLGRQPHPVALAAPRTPRGTR